MTSARGGGKTAGASQPGPGAARDTAREPDGPGFAESGQAGLEAADYQDYDDTQWAGEPGSADGSAPGRSRPQTSARGALLALLALFLAGNLVSDWLHIGVLTGLTLLAGCVAAAWYTDRRDLLMIVAAPAVIFLVAVVAAEVITAQGSTTRASAESVLAGTFLTLAGTAPWLFVAVLATFAVTMFRGLPQCVRELRSQLRGDQVPQQHGDRDQTHRAASWRRQAVSASDSLPSAGESGARAQGRREGQRGRRSSCGSANTMCSCTDSTSSTVPKPAPASLSSTPVTRSSGTEAPLVTPMVSTPSSQA